VIRVIAFAIGRAKKQKGNRSWGAYITEALNNGTRKSSFATSTVPIIFPGNIPQAQTQTVGDMLQFGGMPYSFQNVPVINGQIDRGILLVGPNRDQTRSDILAMNPLLEEAYNLVPILPRLHISQIRWVPEDAAIGDYSRLFCNPYTKTGKISKFPLRLLFETQRRLQGDGVDGELFYTSDGAVGRAKLLTRRANKSYTLVFSLNKGEFSLDYASTIDATGRDVNLYKRP